MAIIVDIDNTLLRNGVYPIPKTVALVQQHPDTYLITGRPESERAKTVATLHDLGIQYKALLMNTFGTDPQGQLHSKRVNAEQVMAHAQVELAVDDNPSARLLYKKLGIPNVTGP